MEARRIEARGCLQTTGRIQGGVRAAIEGLCRSLWLGASPLRQNGSVGTRSKCWSIESGAEKKLGV
jgi:hypothetical protein